MEKPDFSDLYKFYVSLGILLIALSGFAVWLIFTSNEALVIKVQELNELTDIAKELISKKQINSSWVYKNIINIAGVILLPGVGLIWFGLKNWHQRQKVVDKIQDRELDKLDKEFKGLTTIENEKRIKNEIIENEGMEPDVIIDNKDKIIEDYRNIENEISKAIINRNKNTYEIRHNLRVDNNEYDLILIPKKYDNRIVVVEIKYYTKEIKYSYLMNGIRSFLLSIESLKNYFNRNRIIEYDYYLVMLWIYKTEEQYLKLKKYKDIALNSNNINSKEFCIQIVNNSEINNFKLNI